MRRYLLTLFLLLVALGLTYWLFDALFETELPSPDPSWNEFWNTMLLFLGIWIPIWIVRARRRLVIDDFADHRGMEGATKPASEGDQPEDEGPSTASGSAGLAPLLALELSRLARLYRGVDEKREVSTVVTNQARAVTPGPVAELGDRLFQDAVSAEHTLSLGPLSVPVGAIMGLVGRLAQGPRIIGHVYGDETSLVLTARMAGRGGPYTWQVARTGEAAGSLSETSAAITELATRIFTDLALDGAVRWQGTSSFLQGLDAYRDSLRTPKQRRSKLRDAERHFIEAASEDLTFDLAFYNLAVVYVELGERDAAEQTFRYAIRGNSGRLESYYGLAQTRFQRERDLETARPGESWRELPYRGVAEHCVRVLNGRPEDLLKVHAQALRAAAERRADIAAQAGRTRAPLRAHRAAVRAAMRSLVWTRLTGRDLSADGTGRHRLAAIRTLAGLADERAFRRYETNFLFAWFNRWRAEVGYRRAIALGPAYADICFELGQVSRTAARHRQALVAVEAAVERQPDNVLYRAAYAGALAEVGRRRESVRACGQALAFPSSPDPGMTKVVGLVAAAFRALGEEETAERVLGFRPLTAGLVAEAELLQDPAQRPPARERLREQLAGYEASGHLWEHSQVAIVLALDDPEADPAEAVALVRSAIAHLQDGHAEEIRQRGLRARLALLLLKNGEQSEAITEAERALSLDPVSMFERSVVGSMYLQLRHFDAAREALEVALLTAPENPELHRTLGFVLVMLAINQAEGSERDRAVGRARLHLEQALDLYPAGQADDRAYVLRLLGEICHSTDAPDAAANHFVVAASLQPHSLMRRYLLGAAYLANKRYDEARGEFEAVRDGALGDGYQQLDEILEEDDWGAQVTRAELMVRGLLGLASVHSDTDTDTDAALTLVEQALAPLASVPAERQRSEGLEAALVGAKGWLLLKKADLGGAIELLERSVALKTDATSYARLGIAYLARAATEEGEDRAATISRARACEGHARATDSWNEQRELRDELKARLEAVAAAA